MCHECALNLTDLEVTSLLFDYIINLLIGAVLLALAKSIYIVVNIYTPAIVLSPKRQ